ncbi:unnamed protein product [Cladocopium goreaui]|uniref:Uncharacterized protein n=1 Tax=Cladocopium goreaui TaxID=2562237 RepID=A0A9P1GRS7_9DINO|nr:unnamed protein product [Cladocopium goreaui]
MTFQHQEDTEPADVQQLEDQMRMLNSNAGLNQDLDIDQLLEPLTSMGTSKALEILSHLEEKASEVKNPTNYILAAVSKRGKGKGKGKGKGGQDRRGKGVIKTHLKEKRTFDPAMVEKVKKRISWLNDKANLNDQLSYDKVGELLLESGPIAEVMKILKTLEENASEVRNPNGYITSAARRLREEGVAPEPKTGPKKQDYRNEPLDKQLRAHIVWLNKEVPLNALLDYDKVSQSLLSIETADAGEILRRLEESAKEVRDPNGYVIKAAQRVIEGDHGKGGRKGDRWEVPEPPPPTSSSSVRRPPPRPPPASTEDDKIAKRVHWLNGHANLSSPLDYDRLASSFRNLGYYQSLEVLNNLEEHASTVRDPTAYVLAGIKKITHDGGSARPSTSQALPAPSKGGGRGKGGEDKLRRQIEWLNDRVCTTGILQLDKVVAPETQLSCRRVPPSMVNTFGGENDLLCIEGASTPQGSVVPMSFNLYHVAGLFPSIFRTIGLATFTTDSEETISKRSSPNDLPMDATGKPSMLRGKPPWTRRQVPVPGNPTGVPTEEADPRKPAPFAKDLRAIAKVSSTSSTVEPDKRALSLPPRVAVAVHEAQAAAGAVEEGGQTTWRYVIQFGNNSGLLRQLMRSRRLWAPAPGDPGHSAGGGSYQERRVKLKACPAGEINLLWTQYRSLAFLNAMALQLHGLRVELNEEKTLKLKASKAAAKQSTDLPPALRCHNHFEGSGSICTKKGLCEAMSTFFMNQNRDPFGALPLTFIVEGSADPQFTLFEEAYQNMASKRIWIVKPAEWANRGCGIRIYKSVEDVRARVDSKERSWAIQKYIERPLLIHHRTWQGKG